MIKKLEKIGYRRIRPRRIHRLGRKQASDNSKPIILKLIDYRDKATILSNCAKLKETGYSIGEDFTRAVREVRKKLWERTKGNRDQKDKVHLTYDKVKINKRLYTWDEASNDIVEATKNGNQDDAPARVTRRRRRP